MGVYSQEEQKSTTILRERNDLDSYDSITFLTDNFQLKVWRERRKVKVKEEEETGEIWRSLKDLMVRSS